MKQAIFTNIFAAGVLAACGSAPTNASNLATAPGEIPSTQIEAEPNINEVKSFVHLWFSLFDRRVDVSEIAPLLAADIHADFLGQVFPSREAFATMYTDGIASLVSADHEVEKISAALRPGGADVQTWVHFRSVDQQGRRVDMQVQQTWRLVWHGETKFEVAEYIVRPALSQTESERLRNRAQAVLYRWFYFYETTQPNFEGQYTILADDVTIEGTVPVHSLAEYKQSLETPYFVFGQNAHHVESVEFKRVTLDSSELAVSILYQGIDKQGAVHAYRLNYAIQMVETGAALPKIKSMTITRVAEIESIFVPTYTENRAKAEAFEQQAVKP